VIKEPLEDASWEFAIKNDNSYYCDHNGNSIKIYFIVLHTMKSESWEHSSNTNSYLMVVELEALLASQATIMKYGLMYKFFSIKLEENNFIKIHLAAMVGFMSASLTRSTR
jgi:hypothetical protein